MKDPTTIVTPAGRRITFPAHVCELMRVGHGPRWIPAIDNHIDALVAGLSPAQFVHDCQEDVDDEEVLAELEIYAQVCIAAALAERTTPVGTGLN